MSDDLYDEAMAMWLEDDYDPLDDSDEDFVEIVMEDTEMESIAKGTVMVLTQDPLIPMFYVSDWGTIWTKVPVDLEVVERCTMCDKQFSATEKAFTNQEATLYLCSECVETDTP